MKKKTTNSYSKKRIYPTYERDASDIAPSVQRGFVYDPFIVSKITDDPVDRYKREIAWKKYVDSQIGEDRRRFLEGELARKHALVLAMRRKDQTPYKRQNWSRLAFKEPNRVPLCHRRYSRKRAIFAYVYRQISKRAGVGRAFSRLGRISKTFNEFSSTRC